MLKVEAALICFVLMLKQLLVQNYIVLFFPCLCLDGTAKLLTDLNPI